jgi:surface antigen
MGKIGLVFAASAALVLSACIEVPDAEPLLGDAAAVLYGQMADSDVQLAVGAMQESLTENLPGAATMWENPATGNSGSIEAGAVFVTDQGVFCRDYQEGLVVGGLVGITTNTACRNADGV